MTALGCCAGAFAADPFAWHVWDDDPPQTFHDGRVQNQKQNEGAVVQRSVQAAVVGPWRSASVVPADVTVFFHIEDAAEARREFGERPIAQWINALVAEGEAGEVWSLLAERTALQPGELFDALLGRRVTFVSRAGEERTEWALLAEFADEPGKAEHALRALKPIALGPKSRTAILELPEHELLIARRGSIMLVGPKDRAALFEDVLREMSGQRDQPSLESVLRDPMAKLLGREDGIDEDVDDDAHKDCASDGSQPRAALYVRHDPPLGGYSIALAALMDEKVTIRQYGSFDASPLTGRLTDVAIDSSILERFEEHALLAMVEPTATGRSMFETFLTTAIGQGLLSPELRTTLGKRRITIVGEADGRRQAAPIDAHVPALVVCLEISSSAHVAAPELDAQFDQHMLRLSQRIGKLAGGADWHHDPLDLKMIEPGDPRFAEFPPLRMGMPPQLSPQSLNWTIARNGDEESGEAFYIVATHRAALEQTVGALNVQTSKRPNVEKGVGFADELERGDMIVEGVDTESSQREDNLDVWTFGRLDVSLTSAGTINGPRIGHHLLSLRDHAAAFADGEVEEAEFRAAMRLIADLAAGMERVRWRLVRPSAQEIDLEVHIKLAPPISSVDE